ERGRRPHLLGRDGVDGAPLVVGPPPAPVLALLEGPVELGARDRRRGRRGGAHGRSFLGLTSLRIAGPPPPSARPPARSCRPPPGPAGLASPATLASPGPGCPGPAPASLRRRCRPATP